MIRLFGATSSINPKTFTTTTCRIAKVASSPTVTTELKTVDAVAEAAGAGTLARISYETSEKTQPIMSDKKGTSSFSHGEGVGRTTSSTHIRGRNNRINRRSIVSYGFPVPSANQVLAVIVDRYGGSPPCFSCESLDGRTFKAKVQGSIAKGPRRVMVRLGDFVLLDRMESLTWKPRYIHHVYTCRDRERLAKYVVAKYAERVKLGVPLNRRGFSYFMDRIIRYFRPFEPIILNHSRKMKLLEELERRRREEASPPLELEGRSCSFYREAFLSHILHMLSLCDYVNVSIISLSLRDTNVSFTG
jgi:hypothetical protein